MRALKCSKEGCSCGLLLIEFHKTELMDIKNWRVIDPVILIPNTQVKTIVFCREKHNRSPFDYIHDNLLITQGKDEKTEEAKEESEKEEIDEVKT